MSADFRYDPLLFFHLAFYHLLSYPAVQVKEDGTVDFKFSHASDYVIVLNDTDMSQTTGSVIASPKTSDNTPIAAAVILLLFGCALMGTAYRKNKHF